MSEKVTLNDVAFRIDQEGFDYCFRHWSSWPDIKDEEFQKLREAYCAAADALEAYVEANSTYDEEEEWFDEDEPC